MVAGESTGALTVITAAFQQPQRFDGLVLVDGATETSGEATDHSAVRNDYDSYVQAFVEACVPEADVEHLRRRGRQILMRADPDTAARMLESHDVPRIAPDRGAVAELVVIEDAGHVPTLPRPHEVVAAIDAWAARLPR